MTAIIGPGFGGPDHRRGCRARGWCNRLPGILVAKDRPGKPTTASGELAIEEYGEKLGIDEISIESDPDDATNQASLLVGKYLSPKLFVSYGVGIF